MEGIPSLKEQGVNVELANWRGVFGAPTMMLGEQMWWGNDRLEFLEEHLATTQNAGGEKR